ncbi:MAG: DNA/RNA nuclease SfsA [Candidatus Thorarchaeota archaeon]|jgi:sugar fermentation stimulation protein A
MAEMDRVSIGTLIDRPNRFLGRVILNGDVVEAFIPNPGRMYELMVKGATVFLRENKGPHRKTRHDLIAVKYQGLTISIDSNLPNRFMKQQLSKHKLDFFKDYDTVIPEPRVFGGRLDFKLVGNEVTLIEVKSCTLVEEGRAIFPDAPTSRGARHMYSLSKALDQGITDRAAVIFVIQRPDPEIFSPNDLTDRKFGDALRYAHHKGVEIFPLVTKLENWNLKLLGRIPHELNFFLKE